MKLRTVLSLLSCLAILSVTTGGLIYYSSLKKSIEHETEIQSAYHAGKIKNLIFSYLTHNQKTVKALSGFEEIQQALTNSDEVFITKAHHILDHFTDSFQVDVSYLMDRKGDTIASSNRYDGNSFIGHNYSFRPYFQEAILGNPHIYMATGVTSQKRGVYYSHPVYADREKNPVGVVVVKAGVETIEKEFINTRFRPGMITVLTGPHGIVFLSDHNEFLFRLLWRPAHGKISEMISSEQFGKGPWEWAGFEKKGEDQVVDQSGNEYRMFQKGIESLPGWSVVHLSNCKVNSEIVAASFSGTIGYILLALCVLVGLSVFILYSMGKSDIVRRMEAEEESRRLASVIRHSRELVNLATPDGKMFFLNDAGKKILGISEKDVTQTNIMNVIPENLHNKVRQELLPSVYRDGYWEGELQYVNLDTGGLTDVYAITFKITDPETGALQFFANVSMDISERKKSEVENRKLQSQLAQAQKMESIGRLAGGVAHDFNNMLSVIIGRAELALMNLKPSDPLYKDLRQIEMVGKRSAELTGQLLAFARKQTISPRIIDLNNAIESMLRMMKQLLGEDLDLLWKPAENLWTVNMDPTQIDQIFANLMVNARDAIKDVGKVTIETSNVVFDEVYCAAHVDSVPGEYILLAVSDNGCGMDPDTLQRIFEPFFTTKPAGQGTGLGLAMIYGIVKQNNGFINVYSEPDEGTTFRIYLPRFEGNAEKMSTKTHSEAAVGGSETILLVEDEVSILEVATMMLEKLGYTILTANTPDEAVRLAGEHAGKIDLLITDVVMPGMNGRDLARQLRALYPNLKQIFMSGYTANVIAHHGVLEEGVHFIQKPFSIKDLAVKVRESLHSL